VEDIGLYLCLTALWLLSTHEKIVQFKHSYLLRGLRYFPFCFGMMSLLSTVMASSKKIHCPFSWLLALLMAAGVFVYAYLPMRMHMHVCVLCVCSVPIS